MSEEPAQDPPADVKKADSSKPFTLEILKLIKIAQQQHGFCDGYYQRYRAYCSYRIRRIRKELKIPQGDRFDSKKRHQQSDDRYLEIPLMLAERCWAYAVQLRQEANTEPRSQFQWIQKLHKASVYAIQLAMFYAVKLEDLCKQDRCVGRTKLESQAYVAWIYGTLQFELQVWNKAGENLRKSQMIYENLASELRKSEQKPYRQRVVEIFPSLRYCADAENKFHQQQLNRLPNNVEQQEDQSIISVPQETRTLPIDRLDDTLPSTTKPIPAKRLRDDLPSNFLELPDLIEKLDSGQFKQKEAGVLGFVKGLWDWGTPHGFNVI